MKRTLDPKRVVFIMIKVLKVKIQILRGVRRSGSGVRQKGVATADNRSSSRCAGFLELGKRTERRRSCRCKIVCAICFRKTQENFVIRYDSTILVWPSLPWSVKSCLLSTMVWITYEEEITHTSHIAVLFHCPSRTLYSIMNYVIFFALKSRRKYLSHISSTSAQWHTAL